MVTGTNALQALMLWSVSAFVIGFGRGSAGDRQGVHLCMGSADVTGQVHLCQRRKKGRILSGMSDEG